MRSESSARTVVHLLRHGEVHNPEGILYGRRDGYHLSERGRAMAELAADALADHDVTHLISSPLERARETAAPLAERTGLEIAIDPRVIESTNRFEGVSFGRGMRVLFKPSRLWRLYNPLKPSWGEPYRQVADRMHAAVDDARKAALGHEAVIVSHQLPIWTARLAAEDRSFVHDPRKRRCTLCSITSFHFVGDEFTGVTYTEPARSLIPTRDRQAPFSAGNAPEEKRP